MQELSSRCLSWSGKICRKCFSIMRFSRVELVHVVQHGVVRNRGLRFLPISPSPHLGVSASPLPPSSFIPAFNKKILVYHGVVQIRLLHRSFFCILRGKPW